MVETLDKAIETAVIEYRSSEAAYRTQAFVSTLSRAGFEVTRCKSEEWVMAKEEVYEVTVEVHPTCFVVCWPWGKESLYSALGFTRQFTYCHGRISEWLKRRRTITPFKIEGWDLS